MFWTRLFSGIVLLIIIIAAIFAGSPVIFALAAILSLIGLYEIYKARGMEKCSIGCAGFAAAILYIVCTWFDFEGSALTAVAAGFFDDYVFLCIFISQI